jgi:hypothetical protein
MIHGLILFAKETPINKSKTTASKIVNREDSTQSYWGGALTFQILFQGKEQLSPARNIL